MKLTRRKLFAGLAAFAAIGGAGGAAQARLSRYYDGPPSDHFDGLRFFDPHGAPPNSLASLVRWKLSEKARPWPLSVPSQYRDEPPARVTNGIRLSFIGHASVLIQAAGLNLMFDPVWSERASPFTFAGAATPASCLIICDASSQSISTPRRRRLCNKICLSGGDKDRVACMPSS